MIQPYIPKKKQALERISFCFGTNIKGGNHEKANRYNDMAADAAAEEVTEDVSEETAEVEEATETEE